MRYYFGFYHWQRHRLQLLGTLIGLVTAAIGLAVGGIAGIGATVAGGGLAVLSARGLRVLFKPSPWNLDRDRFDRLAALLPFESADTVLDIGCGTGRSVVGFAEHLDHARNIIGLDPFDEEIILGNSPSLATRNAERAALDLEVLRADGTEIPIATDSVDVVTIVQVLHDLPEAAANGILDEAARICRPDGRVGIIELPLVNDEKPVGPEHWRTATEATGMQVENFETVPWKGDMQKVILTARPSSS
jgi:SAM-dependent methyltransferase